MKRFFSILVAVTLLVSMLAGCGASNQNVENQTSASNTAVAQTAEQSTEKVLEPITFTLFCKDVNSNYDNFESPISKKIQEKTGVTLKMEFPVGDVQQKIGLMLASNSYPDMVFIATELPKYIEAGAVIKLDDLIEQNAPNIKKLFGKYLKRLRYTNADKSIYNLGTYGVDDQKWEPSMGFEIQHAVVKELGYPQLKTLQDAENAIKTYMDKYPAIDGQPTIGLSLITDDWRWMSAVGNMAAFLTGKPDDGQWYVNPDTHETTFRFMMDDHKAYFQWLNHMNAVGLLDKESFVQKYDQYAAKISSGRVLALNDQTWQYQQPQNTLRSEKKYDRTYGLYPVQLSDKYISGDFTDKGYSAGWGISITKNCKDPVRAMQFLDYLASDEAQIMSNWGIEGVNYTVVDGKRVMSQEERDKRLNDKDYFKKTGIGIYLYPFPMYGKGVTDSTGQTYTIDTPDTIEQGYNPVEKEVLAGYGVKMWKDLYPTADKLKSSDWGYAWQINIPQDSDLAVNFQKFNDLTKKYIAKSVLAKPADFDAVWAEYIGELKNAGVDKANEEFTKMIKEKVDLWNN